MPNLNRLTAILACTLIFGVVGCRPNRPVAAPKVETKTSEGPLLAPPQQPTAPTTP